jgi:flagellar basal body-associated protein FliL
MKKILIILLIVAVLLALIAAIFSGPLFGYKLTVDSKLEEDFAYPLKSRYKAGEEIVIKMLPKTNYTAQAVVNGVNVGLPTIIKAGNAEYWQYSFTMPARNSTLTFNIVMVYDTPK